MRKIIVVTSIFLAVAGSVWSADLEMDTDLMHAIEDTNKNLASNIAVKNAPAAISDAKELEGMFVQVEEFFVKKGNADDEVALSKKSRELAAELVKSVTANEFTSATDTATNLSRTCKTCHNFYKKS